jgi:hypothetical protein
MRVNKKRFQLGMKINAFIVAVALLLGAPAYSQRVLLGAKVAAQMADSFTFPAPTTVNEDRVLFGPMAEVRVASSFMLELNALYKPKFNYTNLFTHVSGSARTDITTNVSAHSWEIPVLLKYRLPDNHVFVGGGFSARNVVGTTQTISTLDLFFPEGLPPSTTETRSSDGDIVNHWAYGPVVAAGADFYAYKVHFQPELRYTRWNAAPFPYGMHLDSFQALIGIALGKRTGRQ